MKIGVDVGYGWTKAMNELGERVSYPSLVAPTPPGATTLRDVFRDEVDYMVQITDDASQINLLVGEAARHSFAASGSFHRTKPPEIHDPLVLTAVALLNSNNSRDELSIVVGLPLAYYATQHNELRARLQSHRVYVSINGSKHRYISFPSVTVVPQGAGILLTHRQLLPQTGYVGVVDIGTYTTEYLLFELRDGRPIPIIEASGSIEAGIHLVHRAVAQAFQDQTGSPLPLEMEYQVVEGALSGAPIQYYEKDYSFSSVAKGARQHTARVITQKVLAAWGNRAGYISKTFLAGGGGLFFKDHISFPNQQQVEDSFFANAVGYLAFL